MSFDNRTELVLWLAVLLFGGASLLASMYRFADLPDFGVQFGPELEVRSVTKQQAERTEPTFRRGDRLEAVAGQSIESLRDFRTILKSLPAEKLQDPKGLRYQLLRPSHRFTIALQGERLAPTALPSGYNPKTDRLVAIDGRPLPDEMGLEGVRSITASKPEALLTFERHNAVFSGRVKAVESDITEGLIAIFLLALLVVAALWRWSSEDVRGPVALTVGLETLLVAWIGILTVGYQWLMGDWVMASCVVVALVLVRPVAILARAQAYPRTAGSAGQWALGIGAVSAVAVLVMLFQGHLENTEMALYAGASVGALYLIYEIVVVAFDDQPHMTLREGGGYLVGILLVALATAIFSWNVEPTVFREELWRWFTVGVVALVWFGDALFVVRGPTGAGYGTVVTGEERREQIGRYLDRIEGEMPGTRPRLVVQQGDESVTIARGERTEEVAFETTPEAFRDVVSIMIQEQARIPLPETVERGTHPLSGIAQTMDIVLALPLRPPGGGMEFPDTEIVLMGTEESEAGELPSFASAETIDFAQRKLDGSIWAAVYIEASSRMPTLGRLEAAGAQEGGVAEEGEEGQEHDETGRGEEGEVAGRQAREGVAPAKLEERDGRIEQLEADLEDARERIELLRDDRSSLADQLQGLHDRWRNLVEAPDEAEALLEAELIEGLGYLLESPEPVVVGGPFGAGKAFTVRYAVSLDDRPPEALAVYDAFLDSADDHHRRLFGDAEASEPAEFNGFVDTARGGALLVRAAERLSDSVILGLCNASRKLEFRLFLAFNDADAEDTSVLEGRANAVLDALTHRELIIPPLRRRSTVLPDLLEHYLHRYAGVRGRPAGRFSERALEALRRHGYPADVREAKLIVDLAVLRADDEVVELEDLPAIVDRPPRPG